MGVIDTGRARANTVALFQFLQLFQSQENYILAGLLNFSGKEYFV
jgi:hypothetical protein